ncbi:acyloxyacyl hydrolase [Mesonia sp. K7]|uniref:acyloxyacyl hydrolase n=1 Tax=Mesonia sp. K7 TaxID=2218606 RepID=UPI000DA6F03F|nr:acyloxyacyl hydrolase [Mesonia sp. K7]PZD77015.1 hypothetical protein DNG35_10260 [Mesonia sp. K7]
MTKKLFFVLFLFCCQNLLAQRFIQRVGVNYGQAKQQVFPFNNDNYTHQTTYLKFQIAKDYKTFKKSKLELLFEPGFFWAEHQLLNHYFIQEYEYPNNYQELRELYLQKRDFYEIALNLGILYRYYLLEDFSAFGLLSIGPMVTTEDTERLSKGFAFSDVIGLGFSYEKTKFMLETRITLKHNSNANLKKPNHGHNTVGFEVGFSYNL